MFKDISNRRIRKNQDVVILKAKYDGNGEVFKIPAKVVSIGMDSVRIEFKDSTSKQFWQRGYLDLSDTKDRLIIINKKN